MANPHEASLNNDLVSSAGAGLLKLIWQLRQTANRTFEPLGVTTAQATLLLFVDRGCTSPNKLAEVLKLQRSAVSALLRELEAQTLVERRIENDDKRRVEIKMTLNGTEVLARIEQAWQNARTFDLTHLTDEELRELIQLCQNALQAEPS